MPGSCPSRNPPAPPGSTSRGCIARAPHSPLGRGQMEAAAVANGKAEGGGAASGMSGASRGAEPQGAGPEEDQRENLEAPNQPADAWVAPDGAFAKRILQPGAGLDKPTLGALCQVFLEAPPGAPLGYPTDCWAQLELGEGDGAWDGLVDACLETMVPGERAELWAPGGAVLGLHLASFAPAPEPWQLDPAEKWALALRHKERGSERYRAGEVGAAARRYARALQLAIAAGPAPPAPEHTRLRADLHANLAACQLRLAQPAHAARNCTKALALRPQHAKAQYRRGLARAAMNDLEGAAEDFRGVLAAEPGNTAARRELDRVGQRARERDARLARAMGKLFS
ncbi:FK506-binding protein-like isoform X1 [Mauremys mutica]|nr:FK506-binding protein-like isoform X1 [Mauremys mutica]